MSKSKQKLYRILDKHSLVVTEKLAQSAIEEILDLIDSAVEEAMIDSYAKGFIAGGISQLTKGRE